MKLSRLVGAAVTWGTLFGGSVIQAQVNYYTASNMTYPYVAPAPVAQPSTYPSAYPSTSGYGYSVAAVPNGYTQFAGPANSPMTRLPVNPTPTLVGNPTGVATAPSATPPMGSVLSSPSPSDGAIFNGGNSPVLGGGPTMPAYAGIGYGTGAPTGNAGTNVPGCGVGSSPFQPFAGTDGAGGAGCDYFGPNRWYGGAYGLILSRNNQRHFTFSFDTANEDQQFTDAKDTNVDWGGGFAAIAGHYFNCGQNAIEAVYWGWFPSQSSTTTLGANMPGDLNGIFNWDSLTYNALGMGAFVNDAEIHALFHENEVHNAELNLLSFNGGYGGGPSPMRYTLLAGFRYFRYRDHLTFRSDPNDTAFTGEVDEIFYDISTVNNLTGFQIGGVGTYCAGPRLSLNAGTKMGLFVNHIDHTSRIGGIAGTAVINNGPNAGLAFNVNNSKNDIAFLSEIFLGCGYCISNRWSASAGYRAIAVTGLAEATDQIYPDLRGINDLYTIESQSSMILHGAYFGAQYCF